MKEYFKLTLLLLIVLCVFSPTNTHAVDETSTIVSFKDSNLYNLIIKTVQYEEKDDDTLTLKINNIDSITELDLSNTYLQYSKKIKDISGLEFK